MLRIHNTLTRQKEEFVPIEPQRVRMYVCGMTVYDYCHIGHARVLIVFDMVRRWLRASGYDVTYVQNITDIDDKIIRRAVEAGETIGALTGRFIEAMHQDAAALGVEPPTHEPRATQYVPQMLSMIGKLEDGGFAYRAADGDVNYAVRRFAGYGRLSGKSPDELRAGERVAVGSAKHDPLDFVLWKAAKPGEPPEATWDSPFGAGRPGWHIECSAMAGALLGDTFDIHGGGADLQFPHHENEIAQSEAAHRCRFVNTWMHNGFVRIDGEKMSKSLGNFFTVRDVLERFDAEVLRLFMLRAHYRSPLNYSDMHLEDARASLLRLYNALSDVPPAGAEAPIDWNGAHAMRFRDAMDDDFNTPMAVAVLFDLAAEVNRARAEPGGGGQGVVGHGVVGRGPGGQGTDGLQAGGQGWDGRQAGGQDVDGRQSRGQDVDGQGAGPPAHASERLLRQLAGVLGLLGQPADRVRRTGLHGAQAAAGAPADARIAELVAQRSAAKKARDFATADRIRSELAAAGVVLEDTAAGTGWRRA